MLSSAFFRKIDEIYARTVVTKNIKNYASAYNLSWKDRETLSIAWSGTKRRCHKAKILA